MSINSPCFFIYYYLNNYSLSKICCLCGLVVRVLDFRAEVWGSLLGLVMEIVPLDKTLHTHVPLHLGVQMGTDISWGGKPVTSWHPVQGSTYSVSLHAKETRNKHQSYGPQGSKNDCTLAYLLCFCKCYCQST